MKNSLLVLMRVFFTLFIGISAFAGSDLVKLRAMDAVFEYPKDNIVNNPFAHDTMIEKALTLSMFDNKEADGSYYFMVSGITLKVALFYFSRGSIDGADINKSPFLVEELNYLGLSDLAASIRHNSKAHLNKWACSGFCEDNNKSYGEVHTAGESLIEVWERLVSNCQKLQSNNDNGPVYISKKRNGKRMDELSMIEACIHI